jgi:tetratricopeptide (TPR) repeat protein
MVFPEKDPPKRDPQATTCVAFGRLQLDGAKDKSKSPSQRRECYDTARKYFQQGIKTDPKCADAYYGLAQAYDGLGDHAKVIDTYHKAQKAFPKEGSFYYEMAMHQARRKEWGSSLENLTKATELSPDNRMYANMRGHCLARMGRYDEALAWFTKTVGEAEANYNVARMLHHNKQNEACKQHLQRALELQPGFPEAQEFLAKIDAPQQQPVNTAVYTPSPSPNGRSQFADEK